MTRWLPIFLLLLPVPVRADVGPGSDGADPRVMSAIYRDDKPIRVQVAVGRQLTVLLPRGDRILSTDIDEPSGWQINIDADGRDSFVLIPTRPAAETRARIRTASRTYLIDLSTNPPMDAPLYLRIVLPASKARPLAEHTTGAADFEWKLAGNRELMPVSIRDDGTKTYLEWNPDQAIPAVLAIDRLKREEMINGYMRGSVFTIDRVYDHLVFRLDKASADARRKPVKKR
jgi:type IV secretion system protein VirB9